jgi:hypothetical protein
VSDRVGEEVADSALEERPIEHGDDRPVGH